MKAAKSVPFWLCMCVSQCDKPNQILKLSIFEVCEFNFPVVFFVHIIVARPASSTLIMVTRMEDGAGNFCSISVIGGDTEAFVRPALLPLPFSPMVVGSRVVCFWGFKSFILTHCFHTAVRKDRVEWTYGVDDVSHGRCSRSWSVSRDPIRTPSPQPPRTFGYRLILTLSNQ
jgi:hypothetical protein